MHDEQVEMFTLGEGMPKIRESVNQEECDSLVNIMVGRELIDVVVSPASRQLGPLVIEGVGISWVGRHDG